MVSTSREQITLTLLGGCGLIGVTVLWWQQGATGAINGTPVAAVQWDHQLTDARQLDVNRATATELERLPQVGAALARRIVGYRDTHGPFDRPEDVAKVRGIGPKTLEALRPYLKTRE